MTAETKRILRESIPGVDILLDGVEQTWSKWHIAKIPVQDAKRGTFMRCDKALNRANLPPHTGGVYEIAITDVSKTIRTIEDYLRMPEEAVVSVIPVYVGRAQKVRKDYANGVTLRERIFTRYCGYGRGSGGQLASVINDALAAGYAILFRWCQLPTAKSCCTAEKKLLDMYDYDWNTAGNETTEKRLLQRSTRSHKLFAKAIAARVKPDPVAQIKTIFDSLNDADRLRVFDMLFFNRFVADS